MAKAEALKIALESLRSAVPELKGVLLASNEGLPIAHAFTNGADPNRVAAVAAAASSLGRRVSESIQSGTLSDVAIQAEQGSMFVYSAGPKAVLAVLGPQDGNAGLIHLEARTTAQEIADLFEFGSTPIGGGLAARAQARPIFFRSSAETRSDTQPGAVDAEVDVNAGSREVGSWERRSASFTSS
jgi:uncharacterized protein